MPAAPRAPQPADMRVYMVMTVLAPLGGIEAALVPISLELQSQGHEVVVYAREPLVEPNQNAAAVKAAGVRVLSTPVWFYRLAWPAYRHRAQLARRLTWLLAPAIGLMALADALYRRRSWLQAWRGAVGRVRGWLADKLEQPFLFDWQLRRAFKQRPPDVVHVHGWDCGHDPPGMLASLRAGGYVVVFTEHNSPDPNRTPPYADSPLNLAHAVIAVSEAGRRGVLHVGRARPPVTVIPYGVPPLPAPPEHPRPAGDGVVITCVARLHPQKGHADLLEAIARIVATAPALTLQLAGAGPLHADLESRVRRLGLEAQVTFLGLVTRDRLSAVLAATDVVVLPSYWEGLPVSLIEALSAGVPIVASDAGGNPELVRHRENGLIFPAGNVEALAAALLELACRPELRRAMGAASRRQFAAGAFAVETVTRQLLAVYGQAMQSAGRRPTGEVTV
jgi:glycosyltransferase involved in cell wall biosynthesis